MGCQKLRVRIVQKRLEADGVVSLLLRGLDTALPAIEPGAHIELTLPGRLARQYSLCQADAERNEYEIAVLREPASRGGSAAVHDQLQVGQDITVSAPRNHFPLDGKSPGRILLFAGGIGVTPIMTMAEALTAAGRTFAMHYCGRTAASMAYVERLRHGVGADQLSVHLDDGPAEQRMDTAAVLSQWNPGDRLYVCGPAGFINHVLDTAVAQGWPDEQLIREYFAAPDQPVGDQDNQPFTVKLGSSGLDFLIPADRSIAEVLAENGVFIPTSCSEGICGTCVVNVLEGEPDHRDFLFSEAERQANDKMTTCCSRAKSKVLVLDL